jgi:histidyl-tRNA synthetase
MADSILVVLDETQRIHGVMAYLKFTARPGDRIIFLIRAVTSTWGDVETHLPMLETGNITAREYRGIAWRFNLDQEKQKAERDLALVCGALRRKGIDAEVRMYAGGLSKAVREGAKAGASRLIVMPANYPKIQVVKAFLAALKLFRHHLPLVALLPPRCMER